jgi:hypothetical protein
MPLRYLPVSIAVLSYNYLLFFVSHFAATVGVEPPFVPKSVLRKILNSFEGDDVCDVTPWNSEVTHRTGHEGPEAE